MPNQVASRLVSLAMRGEVDWDLAIDSLYSHADDMLDVERADQVIDINYGVTPQNHDRIKKI